MKKTLKITALLFLCAVLLLCAAAAYKIYRQFVWNDYLLGEKLDNLQNSVNSLLYQQQSAAAEAGWYRFEYPWLEGDQPVLIAHALGGVDGYEYTNSLEALELAYENGLRVFEADIQIVDGQLLLLHDLERAAEMCGFESTAFSADDYLASELYGRYTPMSWRDLLAFMQSHPDVYVVTDTKYNEQPHMSYAVAAVAAETQNYDAALLDRVIVQIYSRQMLESVMDIYPFKSVIYTLYMSADDEETVRSFCAGSGVGAVTMPQSRCSEEFTASLGALGVSALTHTVNDAQQGALLSESGVSGLYTDFLTPADFAK